MQNQLPSPRHDGLDACVRASLTSELFTPSIPKSLCIRFTRAQDIGAILELFNGPRKEQIDPHGKIRSRSYEEIMVPVQSGSAVIGLDEENAVRMVALASHHADPNLPENSFTEIGGVMCDVRGAGLIQASIAVLTLNEAKKGSPYDRLFARVSPDNSAARKVFSNHLHWDTVENERLCATLFATQESCSTSKVRVPRIWYEFGKAAHNVSENLSRTSRMATHLETKDGKQIPVAFEIG